MKNEFLAKKQLVDASINEMIKAIPFKDSNLFEPIEYVLTASGKRIRGVLTLLFCERLGVPQEQAMPFAAALEAIHAYSLVHDDLPEMDNDDYRRGIPTCHKKYGHAMALLAGDGILNFSIEYLLSKRKLYQSDRLNEALLALFSASGGNGMLGGQTIDKLGETRKLSLDELLELHRKKTGALLLAPIQIAQSLSGIENENYVNYSKNIGLAFQIQDDILDVEGSDEKMGKTLGKDFDSNKTTFVSLLGIDEAKEYLAHELNSAKKYASEDPMLYWIAEYIGKRDH